MNFSKFFKSRDYENMDRFFLQQKINSTKDPFEGDPFKVQSLNFRYADRPKFYPISNRSKSIEVAEKLRTKNVLNPSHQPSYIVLPQKSNIASTKTSSDTVNGRKYSSICSFPTIPKAEKSERSFISNAGAGAKLTFSRSRSFINADVSRPNNPVFQQRTNPILQQRSNPILQQRSNPILQHRSEPKARHSRSASKENNEPIANINLDHTGGCKISIKINGIPSNQVHFNEKVPARDMFHNRSSDVTKVTTTTISSPYDLKPSRSYVIRRDDSVRDNQNQNQNQNTKVQNSSSRKEVVRECSTHSMIPHKEEKSSKELRKQSRSVADFNASKSEPSRRKSSLNLSRSDTRNMILEKFNRNNSSTQLLGGIRRTGSSIQLITPRRLERQASSIQLIPGPKRTGSSTQLINGRNLERRASMLEKILSNNPIVPPSHRKNFLLKKSVSVLDQRMTPLQPSRKFFSFDQQR